MPRTRIIWRGFQLCALFCKGGHDVKGLSPISDEVFQVPNTDCEGLEENLPGRHMYCDMGQAFPLFLLSASCTVHPPSSQVLDAFRFLGNQRL